MLRGEQVPIMSVCSEDWSSTKPLQTCRRAVGAIRGAPAAQRADMAQRKRLKIAHYILQCHFVVKFAVNVG